MRTSDNNLNVREHIILLRRNSSNTNPISRISTIHTLARHGFFLGKTPSRGRSPPRQPHTEADKKAAVAGKNDKQLGIVKCYHVSLLKAKLTRPPNSYSSFYKWLPTPKKLCLVDVNKNITALYDARKIEISLLFQLCIILQKNHTALACMPSSRRRYLTW